MNRDRDIVERAEAEVQDSLDGNSDLVYDLTAEIKRLRASLESLASAGRQLASSGDALIASLRDEIKRLRTSTVHHQVIEFHKAFGQDIGDKPKVPSDDVVRLRVKLVAEEFVEMLEAVYGRTDALAKVMDAIADQMDEGRIRVNLPEYADALADLAYVIEGANLAFGIDGAAVLAEVHAANMRKLGPDGKPIIRADGKRQKPAGWVGPDIAACLKAQGWEGE